MKITININTDNAAFDHPDEVGRITQKAIYQCPIGETRVILDVNGNNVGEITIEKQSIG